jgi:hypothetical protein
VDALVSAHCVHEVVRGYALYRVEQAIGIGLIEPKDGREPRYAFSAAEPRKIGLRARHPPQGRFARAFNEGLAATCRPLESPAGLQMIEQTQPDRLGVGRKRTEARRDAP